MLRTSHVDFQTLSIARRSGQQAAGKLGVEGRVNTEGTSSEPKGAAGEWGQLSGKASLKKAFLSPALINKGFC